jgi:lysophospholipase L1-like esterase
VIALLAATCGLLVASASSGATSPPSQTPKAVAFHDGMRELWEDHGAWTRMAITSFAANSPDLNVTEARLLSNQTDIGNAVKPYYGSAAGNELTALLKQHILDAVGVLVGAKSGSNSQLASAEAAFYANGRQVAAFLHAANPRNWSLGAMRQMMKIHLNQVVVMGADELTGNYAGSAAEWNPYRTHLLAMADMLSSGIIQQFPGRFR